MSNQLTASVGLSLGRENEFFVPIIEFPVDDRNSPPLYLPQIVVAQDQKLPKELEDQAWAQHDKDDPLAGNNGGDDPLKLGDTIKTNSGFSISLPNDKGGITEYKTPELRLVRYGAQVIHIFTPKPTFQEKMRLFSKLNQSIAAEVGTVGDEENASSDYQNRKYRKPLFDPQNNDKKGDFNQLNDKNELSSCCGYVMRFWFCGRFWRKVIVVSGNRAEYNGSQIQSNGRKEKLIRETLHFSGSQEQRIKYWYDNPSVAVIDSTDFLNQDGNYTYRPVYKGEGKFFSPREVWGTLIVEYKVSYSEFLILYDFPDMKRPYEVMPGAIEKVGYITVNANDKPIAEKSGEPKRQGYSLRDGGVGFQKVSNVNGYIIEDRRGLGLPETLVEGDIGYDRIELDKDWIRNNKTKSDFKKENAPQVALKLLKKVRFKPMSVQPIDIFYTNGKRSVSATFSAPQPIILDMPEKELPKVAIFEKRLREKTSAGGWNINAVEIKILDILGNVTSEKLEMGWKTDWKNKPSKGVGP